ncbi:DEAD-box ATP-dependent RNA helicase 13-like [Zingiber officinale]|uniref:DEAD-box ATP-dependent RNA helicase 13-like n=1 Tax=Zingiber officinale TaxID=94328 RepID=UPI001C4AAC87|nr:DEAD-box ATP-dependent RNA helicase 13-like [Zingiber officinale]XP_042451715.1 DEAD-box ATP-dependent RNA helicase 13-like [Zingiber officinale]XP_042451716.1 DEAD-box ATP-dependent RNA helicase 13-like [Zingiber officinale]XP_042451717.1 DEAD-box ATP-dependent RNA helicase 13-like [Zingiber officinale]
MPESSPPLVNASSSNRKHKKVKPSKRAAAPESNQFDSLAWNDSLPSEDPLFFIEGSSEGGFISLEEIDESVYGLIGEVPSVEDGKSKKKLNYDLKSKKKNWQRNEDVEIVEDGSHLINVEDGKNKKKLNHDLKSKKEKRQRDEDVEIVEDGSHFTNDDKGEDPSKSKTKKRKIKRNKKDSEESENLKDIIQQNFTGDDDNEKLILDEDEVYAWKELRLHTLLIKSIRRLGFKEPTPIQKACIPVAAHQGKDVIGAAETGSGKTLAFGLPILQRLLEEREKEGIFLDESNTSTKKVFHKGPLRALIITPTRELALQVSNHLKEAARFLDIQVVTIVGGMSTEKQERLLKRRPEIVVGTPGRLWEIMSAGEEHLVELHSLSFFVLDEADRMIEKGHFHEMQSIIDMLPMVNGSSEQSAKGTAMCKTVPNLQQKKRQTFVFSATIALSDNFRRKLKRGFSSSKTSNSDALSSIETLSQRAGIRPDVAVVDLTNTAVLAHNLEESFLECREEDKEAYLCYILSVHGQGRTIVFCTSIAALRRISSILRILCINSWTLHAQMQQRARLKAIDRFSANENGVLIATDVAARGLDIPGIRTVVHYQLPHSADVYIHRSGRTARASADGCSISLISSSDKTKFFSLCRSLSKESLQQFPVHNEYMPEIMKRLSLARQIDKISHNVSQENVKKKWLMRNAESLDLVVEESGSEEDTVKGYKQKKMNSVQLKKLQQELNDHLKRPLQPKTFSRRYLAGAGVSPLLQQQLEELQKWNTTEAKNSNRKPGFLVIGQDLVEPLQALRSSGHEVCVNVDKQKQIKRAAESFKRKKLEEKKCVREKQRQERKKRKEGRK